MVAVVVPVVVDNGGSGNGSCCGTVLGRGNGGGSGEGEGGGVGKGDGEGDTITIKRCVEIGARGHHNNGLCPNRAQKALPMVWG